MAPRPLRPIVGFLINWNHRGYKEFNILQPDHDTDHPIKLIWGLANLLDLAGITPQLRGVYLYVPRLPALDAQFRTQLRQRAQRNSDFKFTLQV